MLVFLDYDRSLHAVTIVVQELDGKSEAIVGMLQQGSCLKETSEVAALGRLLVVPIEWKVVVVVDVFRTGYFVRWSY